MHLTIVPESERIRLLFNEEHSWNRENFYQQMDSFSERILTEYDMTGLPLIFDFSSLRMVDSLLIGVLVGILRKVPQEAVVVCVPDQAVYNIFKQLSLDKILQIVIARTAG